ncbi:MAG TPA: hypothetical protein VMV69_23125 [Pirellulales bacterium]|nr:hypothetical protein [Pirellulales bacterium]
MNPPANGYSSNVRLELRLNGNTLQVAQVAPDWCILMDTIDHPPCDAELVMYIDDHRRTWQVKLPDGISKTSKRVQFG